jgi:hypothetical protein
MRGDECLDQPKTLAKRQDARIQEMASIVLNTRNFSLRAELSATSCAALLIPEATILDIKSYVSSSFDATLYARLVGFAEASLHLLTLITLSQSAKVEQGTI